MKDNLETANEVAMFFGIAGEGPLKIKRTEWMFQTLPAVAKFFKVSLSTVNRWRAEGMPWMDGGYDGRKIVCWHACFGPGKSSESRERYLHTLIYPFFEWPEPTFDVTAEAPAEPTAVNQIEA